jgi:hypothetical protein
VIRVVWDLDRGNLTRFRAPGPLSTKTSRLLIQSSGRSSFCGGEGSSNVFLTGLVVFLSLLILILVASLVVAVIVICRSRRRVEFELLGTDSLTRAALMAGLVVFLEDRRT